MNPKDFHQENFKIDTKYASIETKLPHKQVVLIFLIVLFTIGIPVYKIVGLDSIYVGLLSLFVILILLVSIFESVNQRDPMSSMLDVIYGLEIQLSSIKDTFRKTDNSDDKMILRSLLMAYETCYFRSHLFGPPSLQNALKDKVEELKNEIKIKNE